MQKNHETLTSGSKLRVAGGDGCGRMGWLDDGHWGGYEGMCYGECYELCKTDESQTCTPETNNTLSVNKK